MTDSPATATLEARDILKILPHRYPFLMVDRVTADNLAALGVSA